jgi:hypothetical protein
VYELFAVLAGRNADASSAQPILLCNSSYTGHKVDQSETVPRFFTKACSTTQLFRERDISEAPTDSHTPGGESVTRWLQPPEATNLSRTTEKQVVNDTIQRVVSITTAFYVYG